MMIPICLSFYSMAVSKNGAAQCLDEVRMPPSPGFFTFKLAQHILQIIAKPQCIRVDSNVPFQFWSVSPWWRTTKNPMARAHQALWKPFGRSPLEVQEGLRCLDHWTAEDLLLNHWIQLDIPSMHPANPAFGTSGVRQTLCCAIPSGTEAFVAAGPAWWLWEDLHFSLPYCGHTVIDGSRLSCHRSQNWHPRWKQLSSIITLHFIERFAQRKLEIRSRIYMIGDNPAADVRGANSAGDPWRSILVCTGSWGRAMDLCF